MKTVRDIMTADIIRLSPTNKIKTAIILMKGHNIGGLPVLEDDRVVGVLDYHDVLGKDNDILVQNIMDKEFVTVPSDLPVGDAANLMTKTGSSRLLVMEESTLIGVVTRGDLLPELGKSFDPITGLPRADAMRDWGIDALKRGQEITVIFVDLDRFGLFNKKYGHITGDKVLQHVAQALKDSIDEERDMLCRYAGDEFVVITTRTDEDARELADFIGDNLNAEGNPDIPEPVTGSIGLFGGKRTREREHVHYEATLDNLINLASKSCTLAKDTGMVEMLDGAGAVAQSIQPVSITAEAPPAGIPFTDSPEAVPNPPSEVTPPLVEQPPQPMPSQMLVRDDLISENRHRLNIQSLNISWSSSSTATAEVELGNGETASRHSRTGFALGNNSLRLVAEATAEAVTNLLQVPNHGVVVDSVNVIHGCISEDIILVTAMVFTPQIQIRVSGSAIVRQDVYRAAASALLNAVNRQISSLI